MASEGRIVRVFVSSSFRDMHAERDELVKHVFPRLRKLCEDRGVSWTDVDLRWGVTDEQRAEGRVLPICLAEIDHCRPYFIGLLGERYGHVPAEMPEALIEQQPWLAEYRDRSVTELEILHAALNHPKVASRAFFYMRDPRYVDRMPNEKKAEFIETDPEAREKLTVLKQRIRNSGLALCEDYPDSQTMGESVLHDFSTAIKQDFPEEKLDPLDREAAEHEAFAQSRARVYIRRDEYFRRLDEHARGGGEPLVILGESGVGKSALLANWALEYRGAHLDDLVLMHFIGSSPYSADWAAMLRRIMGEFKRRSGGEQGIPDKPDELRAAFANWLHMAAARGRVVLVLDGLNQLEDRDGAPDLVWLPPVIPDNVRLILSTLPGRSLDDLRRRNWPALRVQPLEALRRQQLIADYLKQYTKELSPARVERIAQANETANPLYLRVLLEELRVFGAHEELDQLIGDYLEAATIPALYERILERYEADYERERPGLIRDAMSLVWAARRGLSEVELLELLGTDGEPLPRAHWLPLYLAADQSLVSRSGLIGFAHEYLRQAVRTRYLDTDDQQRAAHLRLADNFAKGDLGPRNLDELPWQLAEAMAWQRLYDLLADMPFFDAAWRADQFEAKGYWAKIENESPLRVVDAYLAVLDNPTDYHCEHIWNVATLLDDLGHPNEGLSLIEYMVSAPV